MEPIIPNTPPETSPKPRILMVEDDGLLAEILVRKLEHEGFLCEHVTDARQAARVIADEPVDLVLLDLVLPGKDGMTFLHELKQDDRSRNIPVVIISNLVAKEEVKRGLDAGAVAYLTKAETTPDAIVRKVRSVLRKRRKPLRILHPKAE